jgi:hypothetical protein
LNLDKCKDELPFINADINPNCLPDNIVDWFVRLRAAVDAAQTSERVMCIMDMARDVEKKCRENPFTRRFLPKAYNDVLTAAKTKMSSLKSEKIMTFSSGRASGSSLEALQDEFHRERSRHLPWF